MIKIDSEDGRVPLELEDVIIKDGNIHISFYFPSNLTKELSEDIIPYSNNLYSGHKIYELGHNESVFVMCLKDFNVYGYEEKEQNKIISLIKDILASDTEALLNGAIEYDFIRPLCSFKIKVCKENKLSIDDFLGNMNDYD